MGRFFGYYVKCQGEQETVAVIFGKSKESSFIQVIAENDSYFAEFDVQDFKVCKREFKISIGKCRVDESGMSLDVDKGKLRIVGEVKFGSFAKLGGEEDRWRRCAGESIMGPFQYLPLMECRHMIVSMHHSISGRIEINGQIYKFDGGIGYIEGDRGKSFPRKYFWTQVHFGVPMGDGVLPSSISSGAAMDNVHISASVAVIPYFGIRFTGTICVVLFGGSEYRLATYHKAKVMKFRKDAVIVKQGSLELIVEVLDKKEACPLLAPTKGKMGRVIYESVGRRVRYKFVKEGKTLFDLVSDRACHEFSDVRQKQGKRRC